MVLWSDFLVKTIRFKTPEETDHRDHKISWDIEHEQHQKNGDGSNPFFFILQSQPQQKYIWE